MGEEIEKQIKMIEKIKNIVFDLGGVLIDLDFPRALKAFEQAGLIDIAQNVQAFSREGIFMDLPLQMEKAIEYWNLILLDAPQEKLDVVRNLRKNYHVHLLSNTNQPHWEYICKNCFGKDGLSIDDYFEKKFLSFEMHLAKPDRRIFQQMLQDGAMLPEETLFIDDSEANCMAAVFLSQCQ